MIFRKRGEKLSETMAGRLNAQIKVNNRLVRQPSSKEWIIALIMFLITAALSCILVMMSVMPKRYDLVLDAVAPETIKATRDIEDKLTTRQRVEAAVNAVDVKYTQDEEEEQQVIGDIDAFIGAIKNIRVRGQQEYNAWERQQSLGEDEENPRQVNPEDFEYSESFITSMARAFPIDTISEAQVLAILQMSDSQAEVYYAMLRSSVISALTAGIKQEQLAEQRDRIVQEVERAAAGVPEPVVALAGPAVSAYVTANMLVDEEALEAARERAREEVVPVMYKKGEIVVEEGKRVTAAQLEVLESLNLLKSNTFDLAFYGGVVLTVLVIFVLLGVYIALYATDIVLQSSKILVICTNMLLVMVLAYAFQFLDIRLVPVASGAILVAAMVKDRSALAVNFSLSFLVGLMAGESGELLDVSMLHVLVANVAGGTCGVYMLRRVQTQRSTLLLTGTVVGVVTAAMYMLLGLLTTNDFTSTFANAGMGFASGVFAGILALGTMPLWEMTISIVTPMKLLELSNPHHPLLRRLLLEAPGTYHHSIMVANLAEQAADAIGAGGLLTRVGAYYHDVGKLQRPYFFSENQSHDNPHDNIAPELSAMILASHPSDGLSYAKRYRLPQILQDIIMQHHGTTTTAYFYHKALQRQKEQGGKINEEDFRYPGPKPQSREAAIIMLADTAEAAVRAKEDIAAEEIEPLVDSLVRIKLEDGQLDDCPLTMREINIISQTLSQALIASRHGRVEYPSLPGMEPLQEVKQLDAAGD
ncbi:MAG: HD family phosphohydrolase [Christensenellales bacterium]|jgi:putative nucleotidyltransferase with HDIG domain